MRLGMQRKIRRSVKRRNGMTLIEVLIVIAILLAVGGLVMMNIMPAKEGADIDTQRIQMQSIASALDMYKLHMKQWPSEEEGLNALVSKDAIQDEAKAANWRGPYIDAAALRDKWNNPLVYRYPGELRGEEYYDLISYGPNGQDDGGQGDDITNHDNLKNADGEIVTDVDFTAPSATGG